MSNLSRRFLASSEYDKAFETRKWLSEIPYINFPPNVQIKVIPPFAGASIRFLAKKDDKTVSVYLDCYSILGAVDQPYWEMFPYKHDTFRCGIKETDELLEKILEELNRKDESLEDNEELYI